MATKKPQEHSTPEEAQQQEGIPDEPTGLATEYTSATPPPESDAKYKLGEGSQSEQGLTIDEQEAKIKEARDEKNATPPPTEEIPPPEAR